MSVQIRRQRCTQKEVQLLRTTPFRENPLLKSPPLTVFPLTRTFLSNAFPAFCDSLALAACGENWSRPARTIVLTNIYFRKRDNRTVLSEEKLGWRRSISPVLILACTRQIQCVRYREIHLICIQTADADVRFS